VGRRHAQEPPAPRGERNKRPGWGRPVMAATGATSCRPAHTGRTDGGCFWRTGHRRLVRPLCPCWL